MLQAPLEPQPIVDPVLISIAALIVAIASAAFTGLNLLRQFLQDRKNKGKLAASVVLRMQWQASAGGSPEVRDDEVLTGDWPAGTQPTFLIHAVGVGHRPVFIKGVYSRSGFPFFRKRDLGGSPTKQTVNEGEQSFIYTLTPRDLLKIKKLVVYSPSGKWAVEKRSLNKALALARQLKLSGRL